jgi:uncharacterized membrane protein
MKAQSTGSETLSAGFFSHEQKDALKQAIVAAEKNTSGEIKVHIESKCEGDVLTRATQVFEKLGMHKTKLRNGVLFYLAFEDRRFAIFGDAGINAAVPENFWDNIKVGMQIKFRSGQFTEGLVEGIRQAGLHLTAHFPLREGDVNELPNDISFG